MPKKSAKSNGKKTKQAVSNKKEGRGCLGTQPTTTNKRKTKLETKTKKQLASILVQSRRSEETK